MQSYKPTNFMLIPTMSCQGRCVYCFGPNKGPLMDEKTSDAAVGFIERIAPSKGKIHITFHGGEPLLAPTEWYRHILPLLRERFGRRLRLSVQSNLLSLSDGMLPLIEEYEISVGTSVDGYKEMCDAQRGEGYYDKNRESRKRLHGRGISSGCICTFTPRFIDKESVGKVFREFGTPFSVHGAVPSLGSAPTELDLTAEQMTELLLNSYEVYKENIADNRISNIDSMAKGRLEGKGCLCTFYDCLGVFAAIDSEGGVYSCQRFCGHEEYCFGNVNDGLTEEDILASAAYKRLREHQDGTKAACGDCSHYDYCMGGCLYNALAAGTPVDPYCEAYKAAFDRISYDMAMEIGSVMLCREEPTPVLSMAGDKPHPFDRRVNRDNLRAATELAKPGAGGIPETRKHLSHPENCLNKFYLHVTFDCPLRCPHCYAEGGERKTEEMTPGRNAELIRQAVEARFRAVVITGGEPLVYKGFDELMALLEQTDMKGTKLILRSSFGFDIPEDKLRRILTLFDETVVSVDGDRASHDARRGEGRYDLTVGNLEKAAALGLADKLGICATMEKELRTGKEGEAVAELAERLSIPNVRFRPLLPLGRGSDAKQERMVLCSEETDYDGRFEPRFSCGLGQNLYVEPDGKAYPCYAWCAEDKLLGDLSRESLIDMLGKGELYEYCRHDVDTNEKCRSCEVRYLCGGLCKAWVKDRENVDGGDFDCEARKEYFLELAKRIGDGV